MRWRADRFVVRTGRFTAVGGTLLVLILLLVLAVVDTVSVFDAATCADEVSASPSLIFCTLVDCMLLLLPVVSRLLILSVLASVAALVLLVPVLPCLLSRRPFVSDVPLLLLLSTVTLLELVACLSSCVCSLSGENPIGDEMLLLDVAALNCRFRTGVSGSVLVFTSTCVPLSFPVVTVLPGL